MKTLIAAMLAVALAVTAFAVLRHRQRPAVVSLQPPAQPAPVIVRPARPVVPVPVPVPQPKPCPPNRPCPRTLEAP